MSSRGVSIPHAGVSRARGRYWCAYDQLEEYRAGMWRPVYSEPVQLRLIAEAVDLFRDETAFHEAVTAVTEEWVFSCKAAFTAPINHVAWMGQAACCFARGVPEDLTRRAWWKLTEEQRAVCDEIALGAIRRWQQRNAVAGLPLFEGMP